LPEQETTRVFSYGTLQLHDVQRSLFGREVEGRPDRLAGYEVSILQIADPVAAALTGSDRYPIVRATGDPTHQVDGTVFELTEAELAAADRYEADDYARALVSLESGVIAWVYVAHDVDS
jgi:gamma-glutamylcyclotransferase (GGCT)/AIG2-like uncharacterized protein YtfP